MVGTIKSYFFFVNLKFMLIIFIVYIYAARVCETLIINDFAFIVKCKLRTFFKIIGD
jgi:hypothetical protein